MAERGISVDHATIQRRIVRYSPDLLEQFDRRKRRVSGRSHVDETYIKVRGQRRYLCRAIDSNGDTIEFWFSERRNLTAAKRFLRKALKRHGRPERIVIDGAKRTGRRSYPEILLTGFKIDQGVDLKPIGSGRVVILTVVLNRIIALLGGRALAAGSTDARIQVDGIRSGDLGWHRDGAHDAERTGEVRLPFAAIPRRAVQHPGCVRPLGEIVLFLASSKIRDRATGRASFICAARVATFMVITAQEVLPRQHPMSISRKCG